MFPENELSGLNQMTTLSESSVIRYKMKILLLYNCLIFVGKTFLNKRSVFKFHKAAYAVSLGFIKFCNAVSLSFMYT